MRIHLSGTMVIMFAAAVGLQGCGGQSAQPSGEGTIAAGAVEKPVLKLGFIKLPDLAPLAIAKEQGFFQDDGLNVPLAPHANWQVLLVGVLGGRLAAAHLLSGPLYAGTTVFGHNGSYHGRGGERGQGG